MNSSELRGYLTGLILGDGFIDKGVTKRSFRIKTIHKDFAEKIEKDLNSCTPFEIKVNYFPSHGEHKEYWEVAIKAHPYFAKKYHHFYDDYRRRIISREALDWLTPAGLANWYMSDGYVCLVGKESGEVRGRRLEICTDRYKKEDIERIKTMLFNKFSLEASVIKRNERYRIRISAKSYPIFIKIVLPYITPSLKYKLYFGYSKKPKIFDDDSWQLQKDLQSAIALTSKVEG